jgi:hypothetical protein
VEEKLLAHITWIKNNLPHLTTAVYPMTTGKIIGGSLEATVNPGTYGTPKERTVEETLRKRRQLT